MRRIFVILCLLSGVAAVSVSQNSDEDVIKLLCFWMESSRAAGSMSAF